MASLEWLANNTTTGNKIAVEGAALIVNGAFVSANNPIPVSGGGGGSGGSSNNQIQGIANGIPVAVTISGNGVTVASNNQVQGIANGIPQPVIESDLRSNTVNLTTTANSFVDIPLNGAAIVGLRFTGLAAANAVITYYSSNDTNPPTSPISSYNAATGQTSPTRTMDGETRVAVSGRSTLRLAVTTPGTGNVAISYNISTRQGIVDIASPIPSGNNLIGLVNLANTANVNIINFPNTQSVNGSVSVVGNVAVTGTFYQNTQPVSIANTILVQGVANGVPQPVSIANTISANVINFPNNQVVSGNVAIIGNVAVTGTFYQNTQPVSIANIVNVNNAGLPTSLGPRASANSTSVTIATDQATIKVRSSVSTTGTQTNNAGTTSATTLLASNANRISYRIYNESTAVLYLLCATGTPSNTNYSVQVPASGYFTDNDYSGIVQAVWAANNGFARVTEMT